MGHPGPAARAGRHPGVIAPRAPTVYTPQMATPEGPGQGTAGAPSAGRLAELLGSLSLATDLAAALPAETAIRTSVIAVRLGAAAGVQGFELTDVFYTGLLRFLGCSAYAHEMAARYGAGDDLSLLRALTLADPDRPLRLLQRAWAGINRGAGLRARTRAFVHLASQPAAAAALYASHCELAVLLARRLGMSQGVLGALAESYERWDGRGAPAGLRGDALRRSARLLHVAWRMAAHHALEGKAAALAVVAARRGRELDPALADLALREGPALLAGFERPSLWSDFLAAEPAPHSHVSRERLGDIARAFAHFTDVKSPFTTGHSPAVAALAEGAARVAGLAPAAQEELRLAGLLHDLGRVAVPNGIWDKPGPLDPMERERMSTHCLETERILMRAPLLAPLAALAGSAHERLDGSGYHRRLPAAAVPRAARLLAAADVFVALGERRPHRPALTEQAAVATLGAEVSAGRLSAEAVDAVLAAAGHHRRRQVVPGALSAREAEIVRLVARGLGNKEIGARLFISASTVKRHLENIFPKIGAHTRAAVAVWALENEVLEQR
jgi:HD-GYP domain-containing protein (c-di-GMP phosphodiesterase class II)